MAKGDLLKAKEAIDMAIDAEEEVQVPPGLLPGEKFGHGLARQKKQYTPSDIAEQYPEVEFTPEETIPVTVHGVRYQLRQDVAIKVPSIVKDVYDESRRERRKAIVVPGINIATGAGGLEAEKYVEK